MKKTIEIKLTIKDYLDKAFNVLPSNAMIHKGRCGIGGTTLEIEAHRNSIIIVPTLGVIEGKKRAHSELFAVKGKVTVKKIKEYLNRTDIQHKKIISTPDSFENIIKAASDPEILTALYNDFFLLFDECHAPICDAFRKRILIPFGYFWNFKNKSLISATPFEFSNPKFKELQNYQVQFHEPYIGDLLLLETKNIEGAVDSFIKNAAELPGNVYLFYNSVTEIAETIRRNAIKDCSIFCAPKEENYEKLEENLMVFQMELREGNYRKINFLTSRYFEGSDIKDKNATIVLVTDINKAHTKIGISNKGVQAIGRLRNKPNKLIHITNHRNLNSMKTIEEFRTEYAIHTTTLIKHYNSYIHECKENGIKPIEDAADSIVRFADIHIETHLATYNHEKVDQVINELVCNEEFNHIDFIKSAWEKALYNVTKGSVSVASTKGRKTKDQKLKEDILFLAKHKNEQNSYVQGFTSKEMERIQKGNPLAIDAYYGLTYDKIEELNFNYKQIEQLLIENHNRSKEADLLRYLSDKILAGAEYTASQVTDYLQYAYNLFRIRNPKTGQIKKAAATHLEEPGRFKYRITKREVNGEKVNIYIIKEVFFNITKAA